jgi:Uma2 family endonuclease
MSRRQSALPETWTVADLLRHFGHISPQRVRLYPPPGTAVEEDVIRFQDREDRPCELMDGVLVEKVMGYPESSLTCELIRVLGNYLHEHPVGELGGADGPLRLMPGLVRIPDVSVISRERLADPAELSKPIPDVAPDLAVEVLSEGNTEEEMKRKLKEYFFHGVRLVWLIDPASRTAEVYTAPDEKVILTEGQALDGGVVLPGFSLPLAQLFAKLPPPAPKPRARRKKRP